VFLKIKISDETTDGTASHLTSPAQDAGLVIGYSHSTRPPKNIGQVAGYKPDKACDKNRRAAYGLYASKIFGTQRSMATKLWILMSTQ
jgi:hypothetical protein